MSDIALVTANFDGIDEVKALPFHEGIDTYFYTDEKTRKRASRVVVESWTQVVVPDYPRHDFRARLRSRYFKHQIHRLDEVQKYAWLVWADSTLQFHETAFIVEQVARLRQLPPSSRVLVVPHPERRTVRDEYEFIHGNILKGNKYLRTRYGAEKMTEQMEHFRARGWDVDAPGLWCGGFWIVENSELFKHCWDDWWDQNLCYGMMDQLSLPVVLRQHGCVAQPFDVSIWDNRHFTHVAHRRSL
jgi:hypothetical protein